MTISITDFNSSIDFDFFMALLRSRHVASSDCTYIINVLFHPMILNIQQFRYHKSYSMN